MTEQTDTALTWVKSSFSNQNGNECVEVATSADGGRLVRDSKDRKSVV